jgi:hypothetical protein
MIALTMILIQHVPRTIAIPTASPKGRIYKVQYHYDERDIST